MLCFLITANRGEPRIGMLTEHLASLGYTLAYATDLDDLRAHPDFAKPPLPLVIVPDFDGTLAEAAIRLAREEKAGAFVVYVADNLEPDLYKSLVRSKAGEWIGWDTCTQELRDIVKARAGADAPDRAAKVLSFLGSKGGVGNTLLALETGIHLSSRHKRPVRAALLDLNLQGGTLADSLDIEPRFDVSEIVAQPERLDEQLIDVFTSRHTPRLDVFAGPAQRLSLHDVPPAMIFTFIDAIARRYEAILIDLPGGWVPWVGNILQGSDAVVLSGGATVPALRALTQALGRLDEMAISGERLAVAVNPCEADLFGRVARRGEIERPLAGRNVFCIRRDTAAAGAALDAGRSLLETVPNARISRDIKGLAEWCGTAASLS